MKKVILLLILQVFIIGIIQAQFKVGIGGGVQQANVLENNGNSGWKQEYQDYYSKRNGTVAGVYTEYHLDKKSNWGLQASLLYSVKGRNYGRSYDSAKAFISDTSGITATWKINYLTLPVNLVYRLPLSNHVRLVIGAGGYAGYLLNSKSSYTYYNASGEISTSDNKLATGETVNSYSQMDYGVNGIAGLDFNDRVMLSFNYSRGLSDFYKGADNSGYKHETLGASLVVWLTKSKTTRAKEAAVDSDGDGVPDKLDKCNGVAGTAATSGCPDTDGDNIPDIEDKCPDVPGLAHLQGCPLPDTDKDGIPDEQDKCPDVAGLAKYQGCPVPDTDGDGIDDENDQCPAIKGVAKYRGCPIPDTDGDGINDEEDKCPYKAGVASNNGCPEIATTMIEDINKAARNILFDVNSDNIKPTSFISLDRIAEILIANPEMQLDIEGHTDNTGSVRHNQILSGKRALAIKTYLVKKGVESSRMKAEGYGSERPIADNNTEAGRSKNRRVAFKVKY